MNEFLATGPFDLYELQLFHLVAEHGNFTRAGRAAGLTQSAISRQIQGMEVKLGLKLFERSTRHVRLTQAGAALHARSGGILAGVNDALDALKGRSALLPRTLRVGVSRTIGLAYLPGFFRAFQRKQPKVQLHLSHDRSDFILAAVESGELDAGVVSPPPQLSRALRVTHRFRDDFVGIAPSDQSIRGLTLPMGPVEISKFVERRRCILITRSSQTGQQLRDWLERHGTRVEPAMEADNFDLIVNLVALGLGVSMVPHRVLALHPKTRPVTRLPLAPKFSRDLVVVVRRTPAPSEIVSCFVDNVLF